MKKFLVFALAALLSGCSMWNDWHWDFHWRDLNPWADDEEQVSAVSEEKDEIVLPATVNKYLWKASLETLSFMGIASENPSEGRIITDWKTFAGERFKIVAKISSGELRADGLDVDVYKEVKARQAWVKTSPTKGFEGEVTQAIITKAKILYINDENKD